MIRKHSIVSVVLLGLMFVGSPAVVSAQTALTPSGSVATSTPPIATTTAPLQVSGWIPYWRASEGAHDAFVHLSQLNEIYPFGYTVQTDGRLKDLAGLTRSTWSRLFHDARKQGVRIIPTVMWSDTATITEILSDPKKRVAHEKRILSMVDNGSYAGVDIDYEGKLAETRDAYSAFLGELKAGLGDKKLVCTVEARTPVATTLKTGTTTPEYANDYVAIGKFCDQVNIMAYDQQRADASLNALRSGAPYYPVADTEWVRKVITNAAKDIPKEKIVLSIPTYGREVSVTVTPNWYKTYDQLWSVSPSYASSTAKDYKVTPSRNSAGELSFTYIPSDSTLVLPSWAKAPAGTLPGNETAARVLAYVNATGKTASFNMVWWSDGEAAKAKIALAKELGLRGVSFFKIDGGEDQSLWDAFKK